MWYLEAVGSGQDSSIAVSKFKLNVISISYVTLSRGSLDFSGERLFQPTTVSNFVDGRIFGYIHSVVEARAKFSNFTDKYEKWRLFCLDMQGHNL